MAQLIADLRRHDALKYCTVVVAQGEAPPGLHFVAPFAATSMAEYFMEQGRDVLIIYDNLTNRPVLSGTVPVVAPSPGP